MIPELHKADDGPRHSHLDHDADDGGREDERRVVEYIDRMHAWIDDAQKRDIRVTQCITDAKGDRSRPPHLQDDPDAYTRVVERNKDGVVIRGAKPTSPARRLATS